jgi:tripartite-type tricarboxylate transporter receptor subunit TctC
MRLILVLLLALPIAGHAAGYPSRPLRLISPFSPGGGNDLVSRTLALALTKDFAQNVVVDNRPGANTIIGMELVAKSAPDGYTLIMTSSTQAINATLYTKLPYDSVKDFSAVSLVASSPLVVAVAATSPIQNVSGLIAAAKARPGALSYPSAGTGNSTHLAGELFCAMAGIQMLHVPYKGSAPGITDLIAGRHAAVFSTAGSVMPHVQTGRLRALATTGGKRSPSAPQLATVAESGVPGYEATTWYGVIGPARLSRDVVARLNTAIAKVVTQPEVRDRLVAQSIDPVGNSAEEFGRYIQSEIGKWAKIVRIAGVKPE